MVFEFLVDVEGKVVGCLLLLFEGRCIVEVREIVVGVMKSIIVEQKVS